MKSQMTKTNPKQVPKTKNHRPKTKNSSRPMSPDPRPEYPISFPESFRIQSQALRQQKLASINSLPPYGISTFFCLPTINWLVGAS
jgi:hypothetical protein